MASVKVGLNGSAVLALAAVAVAAWAISKATGAAGAVVDDVAAAWNEAAASPGGVPGAVVGTVGAAAGLPTPSQTTTDARVARWIIDTQGYWAASKWCGVPALIEGATLPAGSGIPPPLGSAAAVAFGVTQADAWAIVNGGR